MLFAASEGIPGPLFQDSRGWSTEAWGRHASASRVAAWPRASNSLRGAQVASFARAADRRAGRSTLGGDRRPGPGWCVQPAGATGPISHGRRDYPLSQPDRPPRPLGRVSKVVDLGGRSSGAAGLRPLTSGTRIRRPAVVGGSAPVGVLCGRLRRWVPVVAFLPGTERGGDELLGFALCSHIALLRTGSQQPPEDRDLPQGFGPQDGHDHRDQVLGGVEDDIARQPLGFVLGVEPPQRLDLGEVREPLEEPSFGPLHRSVALVAGKCRT